jgi:CRP-like cAMP-binding protein
MRTTTRALEPTICLTLTTESVLSLLAENVEMAEGIMRWLIDGHEALRGRVLLKGDLAPEMQRRAASGLQPLDRVLLLQSSPLLATASGTQLLRLASFARPLGLKTGADPLAGLAEPAMLVVLTGSVLVTTADGQTQTADAGDVIGMYQTLGGTPLGATLAAAADGTALRFVRADVFDVLADETSLLQAVFSGLLSVRLRRASAALSAQ